MTHFLEPRGFYVLTERGRDFFSSDHMFRVDEDGVLHVDRYLVKPGVAVESKNPIRGVVPEATVVPQSIYAEGQWNSVHYDTQTKDFHVTAPIPGQEH